MQRYQGSTHERACALHACMDTAHARAHGHSACTPCMCSTCMCSTMPAQMEGTHARTHARTYACMHACARARCVRCHARPHSRLHHRLPACAAVAARHAATPRMLPRTGRQQWPPEEPLQHGCTHEAAAAELRSGSGRRPHQRTIGDKWAYRRCPDKWAYR
eukprot:207282-Chlamydomonas_euryale.AAC.2